MSLLLLLLLPLAFSTTLLSALFLYAGSAHCRWPALRLRLGRAGTWLGLVLGALSLWLWVQKLGGGAGLCAMLGTWMLALMALPFLAAWTGQDADGRGGR